MVDLKIYEIRCVKCGARFNPPENLSSRISDVRKYVPKVPRKIRRHLPVVGSPVAEEIDLIAPGGVNVAEKLKKHVGRHLRIDGRGNIVFIANKDERKVEAKSGAKRLTILNPKVIDIDRKPCISWTVDADDFEEIPMRAIVEFRDGWIILKCPECGSEALRIRKTTG